MKVRLKGYFDCNFGDEYMIKAICDCFPEVDFLIDDGGAVTELLLNEKNIRFANADCSVDKTVRIIGSGFMINSFNAFLTELVWLIKGKKEPDCCIGCNIEPFKNKIFEAIIRKKVNKYALVTCRDEKSYSWLKKNCKNTRVEIFPDIVFAANLPKPEKKGDNLGISVMNMGFGEKYESYYKALAEAADYYIDTTKKDVYLLAFDTGEENDKEACRYVQSLMKNKAAHIVAHEKGNEIIDAYLKCGKIIGTRFHSAIVALKMGIDLYPVIYRNKMQALLEDIGFNGDSCEIESMDCEGMKKFLNNKSFQFNLPYGYAERAKGHFDILKELL